MDITEINKRRDCGKALLQNNDLDRIPTHILLLHPTSNQTERSLTKSRKTISPNFPELSPSDSSVCSSLVLKKK